MRDIHLYGALGRKFGKSFRFEVDTIAEAIAALQTNFAEFTSFIRDKHFRVVVGTNSKFGIILEEKDLPGFKLGSQSLHIIPVTKGHKRGGAAKIVTGIALIGLSIYTAGLGGIWTTGILGSSTTASGIIGSVGVSMTLAGVSRLISPQQRDEKNEQSFTASGPVSNAREGSIVPIAYGEVITSGALINGALNIVPNNTDDALRSLAFVRIVDAISEGEIEGLMDGEQSIFINKTPISNVKESSWQFRAGRPDDAPLSNVDSVEAFVNIGATISQDLGPITRTVVSQDCDAIKIIMQLNVLFEQTDRGALQVADTGWNIEIRPAGEDWHVARAVTMRQKVTSPTQLQYTIPVSGPGPWDIRISAIHGTRERIEQGINWIGYSVITFGKFVHPHTSVVALDLSSEHIGSSQPTRHYHIRGRKILVPTNYDPGAATYIGLWDGTFKRVWSNNPAWVLYDMLENNVFGIRDHVNIDVINKWRLYSIAQYCDQLVLSGYKDAQGLDAMERRYTYNGVVTDKKEAFDVLRAMTAVWRGMGFYALNQFHATIDMPQDPAHIYSQANVIDGAFEYSTSSINARNSVAMVRYNDPNNFFESAIEPYVDNDMVQRVGWRVKSVELSGCSSRSLAHRYGKWMIETEKRETEMVSFSVGMDSIHALPGEVIGVSDTRRTRLRLSGRIVAVDTTQRTITMDGPLDASVLVGTMMVQKNDGTLASFEVGVTGDRSVVSVAGTRSMDGIESQAMFAVSSMQNGPELFRIISIDESPNETFRITALQFDATKFLEVEQGILFDERPSSVNFSPVSAPANFAIQPIIYADGGQVRSDLELTWNGVPNEYLGEYRVTVTAPSGRREQITATLRTSTTFTTTEVGPHTFELVAVSTAGTVSEPTVLSYATEGAQALSVGFVQGLVNASTGLGGTTSFSGKDLHLSWQNMVPVSNTGGIQQADSNSAIYNYTVLEFFRSSALVRTEVVRGNSFTYSFDMNREDASVIGFNTPSRSLTVFAKLVDKAGRSSPKTQLIVSNSAPAAITPAVTVDETRIRVNWTASDDDDIRGYKVWIKTSNANPSALPATGTTIGNAFDFQGAPRTTYWVTVAAFDAFGDSGLNIGPMISVTTTYNGANLDASLVVPELVTSLPTSGNWIGRLAFWTKTSKLYRYTADGWTPSVSRSDIEGDTSATFAAEFVKEAEIFDWVDAQGGSASLDIVTDTAASGGKALKIGDNSGNDYAYLISNRRILLDPSARYFGRVRLRQSAGAGTVYLGFAGYKADGVTLCNPAGENSLNGQYYVIAGNVSPSSSYGEYKGIAAPAQFHPDVRYISPIILANFNGQAGETLLDSFIVEKVISADRIEGGTITGDKIVANTITGGLMASSGLITQTAQIGNALVTTLKINDRAVTVPATAVAINNYSGGIGPNNSSEPLQDCGSVSISLPEAQPIIVMWSFQMTQAGGNGWGHRVTHNGTQVYQRGAFGNNLMFQYTDVATSMLLIDGVSGVNTMRFYWRGLLGVNLERTNIFVMGALR